MASIFRSAVCVRVWLGEDPTGEHSKAIDSLVELAKARKFTNQVLWSEPSYPPPPNEAAVAAFLRLSWFTRRWIIQELVLNTDAVLYCGLSKISWPTLRLAITKLGGVKDFAATTVSNLRAIDTLGDLSLTLSNRGISNHSILELLQIFDDYGCQDPRDKIFALLGLASDVGTQQPEGSSALMLVIPNYSLGWRQVYCSFARSVVERYGLARALLAAEERRCQSDGDMLPGWVADLQHPPRQLHQVFSDLYYRFSEARHMVHNGDNETMITLRLSMYTYRSLSASETREACWDGLRVQSAYCKPFDIGEADLANSLRSLAKWMLEQLHVHGPTNDVSPILAKLASLLAPLVVLSEQRFPPESSNATSPSQSDEQASHAVISDKASAEDDYEDIANDEEHDYLWDSRYDHRESLVLKRFTSAFVKMIQFPQLKFTEACASFADYIDPEHRDALKQLSFYVSTPTVFVSRQQEFLLEVEREDRLGRSGIIDEGILSEGTKGQLMGYVLCDPQSNDTILVDWSSSGGEKPPVMLLRQCGNKYSALGCSAYECFESAGETWSGDQGPYSTGEKVTEVELGLI